MFFNNITVRLIRTPLDIWPAFSIALLYGLGETRLTMIINLARVFVFRIPVFWFLQNCTDFGQASVGIVMMVSNVSVAVLSSFIAWIVIRNFRKTYIIE